MTDGSPAPAARAVLGHGLALAPAGPDGTALDLRWARGSDGTVGIALVEGVDNLVQDLTVAVLTPTGSDPFDLAFGFDGLRVLTLAAPPHLTEELVRLSLVRTLTADGRVREVLDVTLEPVGADRRQVVRARVRTVLGEATDVALGEVELP